QQQWSHDRSRDTYGTTGPNCRTECMWPAYERAEYTKFRVGHNTGLRAYANRLGLDDSDTCTLCMRAPETNTHVVLECDKIEKARRILGITCLADLCSSPDAGRKLWAEFKERLTWRSERERLEAKITASLKATLHCVDPRPDVSKKTYDKILRRLRRSDTNNFLQGERSHFQERIVRAINRTRYYHETDKELPQLCLSNSLSIVAKYVFHYMERRTAYRDRLSSMPCSTVLIHQNLSDTSCTHHFTAEVYGCLVYCTPRIDSIIGIYRRVSEVPEEAVRFWSRRKPEQQEAKPRRRMAAAGQPDLQKGFYEQLTSENCTSVGVSISLLLPLEAKGEGRICVELMNSIEQDWDLLIQGLSKSSSQSVMNIVASLKALRTRWIDYETVKEKCKLFLTYADRAKAGEDVLAAFIQEPELDLTTKGEATSLSMELKPHADTLEKISKTSKESLMIRQKFPPKSRSPDSVVLSLTKKLEKFVNDSIPLHEQLGKLSDFRHQTKRRRDRSEQLMQYYNAMCSKEMSTEILESKNISTALLEQAYVVFELSDRLPAIPLDPVPSSEGSKLLEVAQAVGRISEEQMRLFEPGFPLSERVPAQWTECASSRTLRCVLVGTHSIVESKELLSDLKDRSSKKSLNEFRDANLVKELPNALEINQQLLNLRDEITKLAESLVGPDSADKILRAAFARLRGLTPNFMNLVATKPVHNEFRSLIKALDAYVRYVLNRTAKMMQDGKNWDSIEKELIELTESLQANALVLFCCSETFKRHCQYDYYIRIGF
uniref:DHC_N1 domain-containing protein n=1 Tax=Macrostomum lignano TaxID=282301 RepID=A0A1I8GBJ1_9PLAT